MSEKNEIMKQIEKIEVLVEQLKEKFKRLQGSS